MSIIKHPQANTLPCFSKSCAMHSKKFNYYSNYVVKLFPDQRKLITYSFNERENTITGVMEEKKDFIYLYEYRGEYIGNEFFISFSKESVSYKLVKIEDVI